jgi:hypothetical protein
MISQKKFIAISALAAIGSGKVFKVLANSIPEITDPAPLAKD